MSEPFNTPQNSVSPTHAEIAQRAYEIYAAQGRLAGQATEHWQMAESALLAERQSTLVAIDQQDHLSKKRRKSK